MGKPSFVLWGTPLPSSQPTGFDSMCAAVPDYVYDENGAINVAALRALLAMLTAKGLDNVSEELHHAEWTVTRDPDELRRAVIHPDHPSCATCVAALDQALAYVAADERHETLLGVLYWA